MDVKLNSHSNGLDLNFFPEKKDKKLFEKI
jgi:Fe-S cluster biosynthesis and repair protein YggX